MKTAIITTHPIQYQIPWFRALAAHKGIEVKVCFALIPNPDQQGVGFGIPFSWDMPLLEGYPWEVLPNRARQPDLNGFFSSNTPGIYRVLRRYRPDAAILCGWQSLPLLQALAACRLLRIPGIVRGDSNHLRVRPVWIRALHRLLLKQYDAFLAIGKANQRFYRNYQVPEKKIFQDRHFIDNDHFIKHYLQYSDQRKTLRRGWNIPEQKTCFLYIGKLEPKKRIFDLLGSLQSAIQKEPDMHLLVVGSGELMQRAEAFVQKHRLPVTFTGFLNQTELPKTYVAGDCLVLPSDYGETWGLVVNEAMVCGLPAVISDRVGCGPDLIIEGDTGYTFPFGDIEALARRMIELAKRPEKIRTMGKKAQKHIQAYSVENTVKRTLQAIEFVTRNTRIDRH